MSLLKPLKPMKMAKSVYESKQAVKKTETSHLSKPIIRNMVSSKTVGRLYSQAAKNTRG